MKKVNLNEIKEDPWQSPGGKYAVSFKGISEALSTTIVGLAIAIPSLIAYSYFSKKIETMAAEMESLIAELLAKCYYQKQRRQVTASVVTAEIDQIL